MPSVKLMLKENNKYWFVNVWYFDCFYF